MDKMNSNKPYLIRAIHEWLTDNDDTPYVLVDGSIPELAVIHDFVEEGKITLNVGYSATQSLQMTNTTFSFSARFNGKSVPVSFPILAVLGIYGRDSGQGMMFPEQEEQKSTENDSKDEQATKEKPHLTLVKD